MAFTLLYIQTKLRFLTSKEEWGLEKPMNGSFSIRHGVAYKVVVESM